ncbi:hypothetical protein B0H34DRAFT_858799 [Crassisporium funariophilum]|nr:hypothetical protein B0H34DRAFT_858799 [Crassisporium funariophilum]
MATRRARPAKPLPLPPPQEIEPLEDDFPQSQESGSSDGQGNQAYGSFDVSTLMLEMLQKAYDESMSRKRAAMEKKFLLEATKRLQLILSTAPNVIKDATQSADEIFSTFLQSHAACKDRIHNKWVEIQHEQANLMKLVAERDRRDAERIKKASATQLSGLSKVNSACKGFRKVIDELLPEEEF